MTAPLSAIVESVALESPQLTEIQIDAQTAVREMVNVYRGVGYVCNSLSAKCAKHGKAALLAAMDADVAAAVDSSLVLLAQVWPAFSDAPFPSMPNEAVPVAAKEPAGGAE